MRTNCDVPIVKVRRRFARRLWEVRKLPGFRQFSRKGVCDLVGVRRRAAWQVLRMLAECELAIEFERWVLADSMSKHSPY